MGTFYGAIPKELIHAAGFIPVQMIEDRAKRFEERSGLLPFLCGLSRNLAGQVYDGIYNFLDGVLVGTVCDTNRHLYDIWKHKKVFPYLRLIRTPSTATAEAVSFYAKELQKLALELSYISGKAVTDEGLWEAIGLFNKNRELMNEFQMARKSLGISAHDALFVVASSLVTPVETHNEMLRGLLSGDRSVPTSKATGPRIFISAMNLNMAWDVIGLVERFGGNVVGDDLWHSSRYGSHKVPTDASDPFTALARGYLGQIPVPGIYGFERRAAFLRDEIRRTDAQGVLFVVQLYCDAYAMEYAIIREKLIGWGIPHLKLEAEDSPGSLEQLNVRVQSFLESLIS